MSADVPRPTIAVVDYGMGNRRSVEKAVQRAGAEVLLTGDHDAIRRADGVIVPGVGAFAPAMDELRQGGFDELIRELADAGRPILGACLGMQLLFERSAENGDTPGLGLLAGEVVPLEAGELNIPHIGWNDVRWRRDDPLIAGLPDGAAFYHVHSYVPLPADIDTIIGTGDYGGPFASVVGRGTVVGCQFHPEKSSTHGLALLRNFASMCSVAGAPA
jgi:glutamine amidotransferase